MTERHEFRTGSEIPRVTPQDPYFKRLAMKTLDIVSFGLFPYKKK